MKTVRKILIVLIILYIAHPLFSFGFLRIFGYSIDFNFDDTHLGLFKPNVGSKVNTIFFSKLYRESDAIYNYKTPRYYFVINEFYQIENLKNIDNLVVNLNSKESSFSWFMPHEGISEELEIDPTIKSLWDLEINGSPRFSIGVGAKIDSIISGSTFKAIVGEFENLYLTDDNQTKMIWEFKESSKRAIILLTLRDDHLAILTIQTEQGVSIDDLKVLELESSLKSKVD